MKEFLFRSYSLKYLSENVTTPSEIRKHLNVFRSVAVRNFVGSIVAGPGLYLIADMSSVPAASIIHFIRILLGFWFMGALFSAYVQVRYRGKAREDLSEMEANSAVDANLFWSRHRDLRPLAWS